jgi:hypothetical protein
MTKEQEEKLKLDARMRTPMHNHNNTMVQTKSTTFDTSTEAKEEGHATKVIVTRRQCNVCGLEEIGTKTLWSTKDQHITTK